MRKTQRKTTQREKEMTGIVTKYLKRIVALDDFYHSFPGGDFVFQVFIDLAHFCTIQESKLRTLCV